MSSTLDRETVRHPSAGATGLTIQPDLEREVLVSYEVRFLSAAQARDRAATQVAKGLQMRQPIYLGNWLDIVQNPRYPGYQGVYGGYSVGAAPYAYLGAAPGAPVAAPALPPMPVAPPMPMGPPPGAGPMGMPFEPRAALVDAPPPTEADRWILPMSTGVPILPTQSAQITGRPQARAYKCTSYKISNGGTAGGAADWIVNDLKVGNRSQFVQSGDVPGDVFATNAVDSFIRFETAQTAMDIVVVVTYIGLNESGVPFFSAMFGTAAV